jgi:thiol-disulfide isomerase/thioredoxin
MVKPIMSNMCRIVIRLVFLWVTSLFVVDGFSQTARITGVVPGAEGKTIRLVMPRDLMTFVEQELSSAVIDSTGQFTLAANLRSTAFASLDIDFHRAELYLEPGKSIFVKCAPMNYHIMSDMNPLLQSQSIQTEFSNSDPDEINTLVSGFSEIYNKFLFDNFNALYRDRQKSKLDSFKLEISRAFPVITNTYFSSYVKYKVASLEFLAHAQSQPMLTKKYFSDAPVLCESTEYMDLFNQNFARYMTVTSKVLRMSDFPRILVSANTYENMMKTLEKDTVLKNPEFRELVMLKGLMEMFNMTGYNQESILLLLEAVITRSKFDGNRIIAEDMIRYLTKLRTGTPAPPFTLSDGDRKAVSLKDFKGKPVLLTFWTTYCHLCLTEMDNLKTLYEKYGEKIRFVSISADGQYLKMIYFLTMKKEFNWTFLHIGDQLKLLRDYDVRSYPLYVLIDEEGKVFRYPADKPGDGLEKQLGMLLVQ